MASKFHGGSKDRHYMLLQRQISEYVPKVYAAIASELWQLGWSADEITDLFNASRERWEQSIREGWDMLQNVYEVTGLNINYLVNEEKT